MRRTARKTGAASLNGLRRNFPPLKDESVIRVQLDAIDKMEQATRIKFQAELERFKGMRANLLALPAPIEA